MPPAYKTAIRLAQPYLGFMCNLLASPREVGALCPSSPALTSVLVDTAGVLGQSTRGLILDLGAGSGVVTGRLLERGVPPENIVAVDRSQSFADAVRKRFPRVTVLCEDACNLVKAIENLSGEERVKLVISSLPFRSLPSPARKSVAEAIMGVLQRQKPYGCLVQYSYFWWDRYPLARYGFVPHSRRFVFWNVPPAVVEMYTVPPQ